MSHFYKLLRVIQCGPTREVGGMQRRCGAILYLLVLLNILPGCARSPTVEYYALTSQSTDVAPNLERRHLPAIQVVLPTIPALVDRAEFIEMVDANRVMVHENIRWAVGLRKMLRDYFVAHLKGNIPTLDISSAASQIKVPGAGKLLLNFDRFDVYAARSVEISASWRLLRGKANHLAGENAARWKNEISVKQDIVGDQPRDAIAAIRVALTVIGDEISRSLQAAN